MVAEYICVCFGPDRHPFGRMGMRHVYLVICCFCRAENATHIVYLIVNKRASRCSLQVTNYYQQTAKLSPNDLKTWRRHCIRFANHAATAEEEDAADSRIYTKSRCQQVSTMFAQALEPHSCLPKT